MSRWIYSSVITLSFFFFFTVQHSKFVAIKAFQQHQHAKEEHPSLLVDTKIWLGNTELGEQENWSDGMKPCTLRERIRVDEPSAISMSDYLDALGGGAIQTDIRDLVLPTNGMLLFEEDTLGDPNEPIDPYFIQYLNESGECHDSSEPMDVAAATGPATERLFKFQPDPDQMSWFNPDNWVSTLNEYEIKDWIPESHRIPCSEDVVVFGSREVALGPTVEANERSSLLSFKVNFEPSQWADVKDIAAVNNIRVSKLKIGNLSYSQHEFEQLIESEQYENILFQFNSSRGVLRSEEGFAYSDHHSLFTIDDSSILPTDTDHDFCLDEAGCLCGNENMDIMKVVCSFNHPIDDVDQPCHDPIPSTGYCNKICATIITIGMDPTRFSEKFLSNTLYKLLSDGEASNYFVDSVFTGARRTHDNKYEITFRNIPIVETDSSGTNLNYQTNLGKEQEFAKLVYEQLNKGATRSFYGMRSISIRSSVDWRRSNRGSIFWISFIILSLISISIPIILDHFGVATCSGANHTAQATNRWWFASARRWLIETMGGKGGGGGGGLIDASDEFTDSFVSYTEQVVTNDSSLETGRTTSSEIPLVSLDTVT